MKPLKYISFLALVLSILIGCAKEEDSPGSPSKQENNSTGQMVVKLTDEYAGLYVPTNESSYRYLFDEVNVDIQQVAVYYDRIEGDTNSMEGWVELETNAGIYDLIGISNMEVVLANGGMLPPGHISQFRLILGNENSVVVDSLPYDLITPSGQQSGLKFNADINVLPDMLVEILLDFDSDVSILVQENGQFILKPVIRVARVMQLDLTPG